MTPLLPRADFYGKRSVLVAVKSLLWERGTETEVEETRRFIHPSIGPLRSEGDFQGDKQPAGYRQNQTEEKGASRGSSPRSDPAKPRPKLRTYPTVGKLANHESLSQKWELK